MENKTESVRCSQCESTDIQATAKTQRACKSCGNNFTDLQQLASNEDCTLKPDRTEKDIDCAYTITPEFTKDQFLRSVLIRLANENAPLEVFNENVIVTETERHVLIDSGTFDIQYQASVGYYKDPKNAFNDQVVWTPVNGNYKIDSTAIVENAECGSFDSTLFSYCLEKTDLNYIKDESANEFEQISLSDSVINNIVAKHKDNIDRSLWRNLQGDKQRDVRWCTVNNDRKTTLYKVPEYTASICINGKTYTKHAFPFGNLQVVGDKIENKKSAYSVSQHIKSEAGKQRSELKAELEQKNKMRKESIDDNIAKATNPISFATIILLVISILVSAFVRSAFIVIAVFAIAVAAFVFNTIKVNKETAAETERANSEIKSETEKIDKRINDEKKRVKSETEKLENEYLKNKFNALNDKLKSLGYAHATNDTLFNDTDSSFEYDKYKTDRGILN